MTEIKETWRPIEEFPKYKVSNLGRVIGARGYESRTGADSRGYLTVALSKTIDGRTKRYDRRIHRLVALAFIENDDPEHKTHVNHKDGNHFNACVYNLEWVTPEENYRHARDNGLSLKSRCEFEGTDEEYEDYYEQYMEDHLDWSEYNKNMIAVLSEIDEKRRVFNEGIDVARRQLKMERERIKKDIKVKKQIASILRRSPEMEKNEFEDYMKRQNESLEKYMDTNKKTFQHELDYQNAVIEFLESKKALAAAKCNELYVERTSGKAAMGWTVHCGDVIYDNIKEESKKGRYELSRSLEAHKQMEKKYKDKCSSLEIEKKVLELEVQRMQKVLIQQQSEKLNKKEEQTYEAKVEYAPINVSKVATNVYYQPKYKRPITVYIEGVPHFYPTVTIAAKAHGYNKAQELLDALVGKEASLFGNYAVLN